MKSVSYYWKEEMMIGFALSTEFVWTDDDDDIDDICYHVLLIDTDGDAVIVHYLYLSLPMRVLN